MGAKELVAWNLRRLRVAQNFAQELLAIDASVDRTYISLLERGLENPTILVLERLAIALDVQMAELFPL
jgi:transcriptional regulator with XRE-family HTH domain